MQLAFHEYKYFQQTLSSRFRGHWTAGTRRRFTFVDGGRPSGAPRRGAFVVSWWSSSAHAPPLLVARSGWRPAILCVGRTAPWWRGACGSGRPRCRLSVWRTPACSGISWGRRTRANSTRRRLRRKSAL